MLRRNNYEPRNDLRPVDLIRAAGALSHMNSKYFTDAGAVAIARGLLKARHIVLCHTPWRFYNTLWGFKKGVLNPNPNPSTGV